MLLDITAWDAERHRHLTGQTIGPALDFARRLASLRRPIWLRFFLVPGLTNHPEDIESIARFAAELGNVERVDVLPFHQMGRFKWKERGLDYTLADVDPPNAESLEHAAAPIRAVGLKAF